MCLRRHDAADGRLALFANNRVAMVDRNLSTINDMNRVKQRYAINFRGSVHDRAISLRDVILVSTPDYRARSIAKIDLLSKNYAASAGPMDAMLTPDRQPAPAAPFNFDRKRRTPALPHGAPGKAPLAMASADAGGLDDWNAF